MTDTPRTRVISNSDTMGALTMSRPMNSKPLTMQPESELSMADLLKYGLPIRCP